MATLRAPEESELKAAIDAIKQRKRADVHEADLKQRARLAKLRHKLGKELQPLLTGAGIDLEKINKSLARSQAEVRQLLEREKAATAKELAALAKSREAGLRNTRNALQHLALKPYLTTPIPVRTPFLIYATPIGMLTDSHTEAWNNWGKIFFTISQDTGGSTAKLNFYFAWQNPSNYLAVINCAADLVANGSCMVDANPGFLFGGSASLHLRAELTVFAGSTEISWQQGQTSEIASLSADGGNIFGIGPVVNRTISNSSHLTCNLIEVQANQLIVFEVAFVADYSIDDGNVIMDFGKSDPNNEIICPALQIDLLSAPDLAVA
jgi:hypothetical protein